MRSGQSNAKIVKRYRGLVDYGGKFNGKIRVMPDSLNKPTSRRKPTVFAVWNDLFHEGVTDQQVMDLFRVAVECQQHTFLICTKRPERMAAFFARHNGSLWEPPPNIWLGTTIEQQRYIDRLDWLMQCPASVHWVSVEPLLGEVRLMDEVGLFGEHPGRLLNWVICGAETGTRARPMHYSWAKKVKDDAGAFGIPFFFKGWGRWMPATTGMWFDPLDGCPEFTPPARGASTYDFGDGYGAVRVGKEVAGTAKRLLDGREWLEMPER